ncbi:hypothetical protein HDU83_001819 [Entophlyctis luteolus]|nr:hypothetical protein HDU82_001930 [Entophlyctis luteolus]KAJ3347767.1 hypothetical protein HDU83_001819 [Entophlyctis luteolus]KAJ3386921.1 hypothetical protein HDU84_001197 [Entophlyctis sp. JEL0112]
MAQQGARTLDLTETITENLTNNILTSAGTRLIQSTLPANVQQRIASRLAPPIAPNPTLLQQQVADSDPGVEFELPPLDFDIPVNYAQASLLVQHKIVRPSRLAFRRLVFDLGAWVTSDATQQSALGTVVFTVITIVLFILAAITYAVFYAAYMPTVVTSVPAYLMFPESLEGFTSNFAFPEASVDFTQNLLPQHALRPDQHYTIGVDLLVPDSPQNYDPGNFMISLNLTSSPSKKKETLLGSAKRPALVAYKSLLLRSLQTVFRSMYLVPGYGKELQIVRTYMVDDYVEREDLPLQKASVRIHTNSIQVFSCNIFLSAHFQGLRYFMHEWFYTTAALFIIFFMFWYALFGLLLWRMFVSWFEKKASQRAMRRVVRKRVNPESGEEEEYETDEEILFEGEQEVAREDMTTRVRVDLGKILKSTSETAATSLAAMAANSASGDGVVPGDSDAGAPGLKKRTVFKLDTVEEVNVSTQQGGYLVSDDDASPTKRSSSLPPPTQP